MAELVPMVVGMSGRRRKWIAERTLRVGKSRRPLIVRLAPPQMVMAEEWVCHVELERGAEKRGIDVRGADSFQSLILALQAIRMELSKLNKPVTWPPGEAGKTGFPMTVPDYFGQDFARRLEAMIEAETERFGERIRRRRARPPR